jgi:hypothetical protein
MNFNELLAKHGKFCPTCGSGQVTSRNTEPMHKCLNCKRRFEDRDALIGQETADVAAREYSSRGDRYDLPEAPELDRITDVVLTYRPKIKTKAAKRRARRNKRAAKVKKQ